MTDKDDNKIEDKLDRTAFFKDIREKILENMGMSKDTKPENFVQAMRVKRIKDELDMIKNRKNN
jgi:hypothetical protein